LPIDQAINEHGCLPEAGWHSEFEKVNIAPTRQINCQSSHQLESFFPNVLQMLSSLPRAFHCRSTQSDCPCMVAIVCFFSFFGEESHVSWDIVG
jgi:hypothetical protein